MAQTDPECAQMMKEQFLHIHGFAFGGKAVGRLENGKVCFVRGAIPGEKLLVRITADKKNYAEGELLEILESSPLRLQTGSRPCPGKCPGCSYAHIPYEMELEWKEKQFRSFAEKARLKHSDAAAFLRPIAGAQQTDSYRNKIRLSVELDPREGIMKAGYRAEDNVSLLEISDCPLAQESIRELLRSGTWKKVLTADTKSITFRCTQKDGAFFFTDQGDAKHILTESPGDWGDFRVAENAFFQVNSFMSHLLIQAAVDHIRDLPADFLVELYCGCGCFSIAAAQAGKSLHTLGIELEKSSVKMAEENARIHNVADRCTFLAGDSAQVFRKQFPRGLQKHSILLVDPPRTGMDLNARKLAAASKADFLIYISCSPDTLFRDLAYLEENSSYRIRESRAVDLFPRTGHFESITLCERA